MNPTLVLVLGIVPAAIYVLWPLFAADNTDPMAATEENPVAVLDRAKNDAYAAIKEAEFDRRTGKLSDEDYEAQVQRFKAQALHAISALDDRRRSVSRPPSHAAEKIRFCPACGTKAVAGGSFCSGCGRSLASSAA
jgi:hypothetical protein